MKRFYVSCILHATKLQRKLVVLFQVCFGIHLIRFISVFKFFFFFFFSKLLLFFSNFYCKLHFEQCFAPAKRHLYFLVHVNCYQIFIHFFLVCVHFSCAMYDSLCCCWFVFKVDWFMSAYYFRIRNGHSKMFDNFCGTFWMEVMRPINMAKTKQVIAIASYSHD